MADAKISDMILWQPYQTLGGVDWPAASSGPSFWPRRHLDFDNIIGPYEHYSTYPNCAEINEGWGLNQIIAVGKMLKYIYGYSVFMPDFVKLPVAQSVDRFPTEFLWWRLKFFINVARGSYPAFLPAYAWTLPYGDFFDNTKNMRGKNKISFTDLTEFRDALNDIPAHVKAEPVLVKVPDATAAPWTAYTMYGSMVEPFAAGVVSSTLKNKYQWRFTSFGSSSITPHIQGTAQRRISSGIGLDQYRWTGNRVIFKIPLCLNTPLTGIKLKASVRRNSTYPLGSTSIMRVFVPPEDPSSIGLSNPGELGSPLQNAGTSRATVGTHSFFYRTHDATRHRVEIRPSTPLSINGSYWPDFWPGGENPVLSIGSHGSSLLTAVSFSNVDLSGFNRSVNITELPLIIYMGGVTVIKATAYSPPDGNDIRSSFVLLLGQSDPCENGLWFFELDDIPGNLWLRKWHLSPASLIPNICYKGIQCIFGWPNVVDGDVWWLTDQPPEFEPASSSSSSSSSLSPSDTSSLSSGSCVGNGCEYDGYSFRKMTEWEKRFMDIYDTPLLGTEIGSLDTASIPNDGLYHDIELNLTGLPSWFNGSSYAYFVLAIDSDLTKLKPAVSPYLYNVGIDFIPQTIIPQV